MYGYPDKDGSMEAVLSFVKQNNLNDKLTLKGFMNKADWIELSKKYDIFINTTNFDNMPVSVIEAMALGLPISTNSGGLKFLHEHKKDALIVEKNDVGGMINEIMLLLKDSDLAENLSLSARKKAESFDWKNTKKLWYKIISKHIIKNE